MFTSSENPFSVANSAGTSYSNEATSVLPALFLIGLMPVARVLVCPSSVLTLTAICPPSVPKRMMFALTFVGVNVMPFDGTTLNSTAFSSFSGPPFADGWKRV